MAKCGKLNLPAPVAAWSAIRGDLTDAERVLVKAMIRPAKRRGRRREVKCSRDSQRNLLRALDRLPMAGAAAGLPPKSTALHTSCCGIGTDNEAHLARTLCRHARARGPGASPTNAIINGQSATAVQKGPALDP